MCSGPGGNRQGRGPGAEHQAGCRPNKSRPGWHANLEAYDRFLSGPGTAQLRTRKSSPAVKRGVQRAVALDPSFTMAWSELVAMC